MESRLYLAICVDCSYPAQRTGTNHRYLVNDLGLLHHTTSTREKSGCQQLAERTEFTTRPQPSAFLRIEGSLPSIPDATATPEKAGAKQGART